MPCSAATKYCRLTHGINLDYRKIWMIPSRDKRLPLDTWNTSGLQDNVFGSQFSTFDSARYCHQGIHSCAPQSERGSVPHAARTETPFIREADICKKAVDCEFCNTGEMSAEFYGWTAKTAQMGTAIRQIPLSTIVLGVDNKVHKWF